MAFATFEQRREEDREATDADRHVGFIRVVCGADPSESGSLATLPPGRALSVFICVVCGICG